MGDESKELDRIGNHRAILHDILRSAREEKVRKRILADIKLLDERIEEIINKKNTEEATDSTRTAHDALQAIHCPLCSRKPEEVPSVVSIAKEMKAHPITVVVEETISYSPEHLLFICDECIDDVQDKPIGSMSQKELYDKYRQIVAPLNI